MKIKICGVCRPEDAAAAAAAHADFIGVILAPNWRRTQNHESAAAIFSHAGPVKRVGVFVDPSVDEVQRFARDLMLDVIQLHGQEDVRMLERIRESTNCVIWKAIRVKSPGDLALSIEHYGKAADGLLLDAASVAGVGGGRRFDWDLAIAAREIMPAALTLIAAGGLTPENVREAVSKLKPDVVDVSSGVEAGPGQKSAAKIAAFVRNAKE